MDFQDPSINDEINAIFADKKIWSVEQEFDVALRTLLFKLYKRGYSDESLCKVHKNVSYRRLEMMSEYRREQVKSLYVEGDTEEAKSRK